jgi:hypothetical protein
MKYILILLSFLTLNAVADKQQPVRTGNWEDGVKVAYQCQGMAQGKTDIVLLYPDGKTRSFQTSCGTPI